MWYTVPLLSETLIHRVSLAIILHYMNTVFCFYCRSCFHNKELSFSKCLDSAVTIDGYKNWEKARCKFECHENSNCHIEAIYKFKTHRSAGVDVQVNDQIKKSWAFRQKAFLKVLSMRQGLAMRLSWNGRQFDWAFADYINGLLMKNIYRQTLLMNALLLWGTNWPMRPVM